MTILVGWQAPSTSFDQATTWTRSGDISSFDYPPGSHASAIAATFSISPIWGDKTDTQPISLFSRAIAGDQSPLFTDDWYHRVHIVPPVIDIGNLLSVQTRNVEVWNAHFTPQALSGIAESGTAGITESGLSAPFVMDPLLSSIFTLRVDTNGPATIDALYTFSFPLESPTLQVTGRRVVVFGHPPNWADEVVESYDWLTDIIESHGGVEQRIGLRGAPRRGLEYRLTTMSRHESNRMETLLLGWQARLFAVPVWTDAQTLSAPLAAGSATVPCQTSGYEFAAAGLAVLWTDHETHEAVEIDAVGGASLTLTNPTVQTWPAGTKILPVRLGRLPASQKMGRIAGRHFDGSVAFAFEDHPGWPAADTGDDYLGYKVYLGKPNWRDGLDVEHVRDLAELDYSTGTPWVNDTSGLANIVKRWNWTHGNRAEIVAFRSWLAARKGRQVPFWSETQSEADMEIVAPIGASDVSFQIRNIGYQRYLNGRADRRHVAIRTTTGAAYYRQVTGATENSDTVETLAIDAALGVLLNVADIASVRFLHLTRLESDHIELNWSHLGLAETTAGMRSIPS